MIADLNINLDTISQQLDDEGKANFSFYCTEEQSRMIMENMDKVRQITQLPVCLDLSSFP